MVWDDDDPREAAIPIEDRLNDVAEVLLYIKTINDREYAIVEYYTVVKNRHPIMKVPYLKRRNPGQASTYGVVEIDAITAHAHVVPDFDSITDDGEVTHYFWDLVE